MVQKLSQFERVSAHTLNKVIDAVNGLQNIAVAPPLEINRAGGRINIRLSDSGFIGAVTERHSTSSSSSMSSSAAPTNAYNYTVQEVQQSAIGQWEYVSGGRVVTAYEWNDSFILTGSVVFVEPYGVQADGTGDWRFDHQADPVQIVVLNNSGETPPAGYYDATVVAFNPATGGLTSIGNCWLKDLNN